MTGFGRATAALGTQGLTVQVSSVNRKTLDLTVNLPDEWDSLEAGITERVRKVATRGKVHVAVEVTGGEAEAVAWDDQVVEQALDRLGQLAVKRGIAFTVTPELLWQVASSQRRSGSLPTVDHVSAEVLATVDAALREFVLMRGREGAALLVDFLARLELIRAGVRAISERAPHVVPGYRDALLKRLREAQLELSVDDERVLKEIALFADRSDIAEELTRLGSHLEQLAALFRSEGEIGRKAEFILQEVSREIHTIGSKANDLVIAKQVIELKNELERIKEQVANVE